MLTTFEDMYETHEQRAQLLAVEGVLLLCNVHFNLPGGNVIQQHSYQLEQEPERRKWRRNFSRRKPLAIKQGEIDLKQTWTQTWQMFPQVGLFVPLH